MYHFNPSYALLYLNLLRLYLETILSSIIFRKVITSVSFSVTLASIADQRVLRWSGHVGRMDEYTVRVLMVEICGGLVRGRQRLGWKDGAKVALGNRGITVEAARQCAKDRKE